MTVPATEIDRVAVALCAELGIDPTETIDVAGKMMTLTPSEQLIERLKGRHANPSIASVARWQLYRGKAAELLAGRTVLSRLDKLRSAKDADPPHQSDPGDETDYTGDEIA